MKEIICVLFFVFGVSSCAVFFPGEYQNSKMQQVKLGMTKEEVLLIVGKNFYSEGLYRNDDNDIIETISQGLYSGNGSYIFIFKNGSLSEWFTERLPPAPPTPQINVNVERKGTQKE